MGYTIQTNRKAVWFPENEKRISFSIWTRGGFLTQFSIYTKRAPDDALLLWGYMSNTPMMTMPIKTIRMAT